MPALHIASALVKSDPFFVAGSAVWDVTTGKIRRGVKHFTEAVKIAKRYHLVSEEYQVHMLASSVLPEDHPELERHAAAARLVRERHWGAATR